MSERMSHSDREPEARETRSVWNSTDRCEAEVKRNTLRQGYLDGMSSIEGRVLHDPSRKESPTVIETTIQCEGCSILHQFQSEGMGFAPSNDSTRQVEAFLKSNCAKLLARGYRPDRINRDNLPK